MTSQISGESHCEMDATLILRWIEDNFKDVMLGVLPTLPVEVVLVRPASSHNCRIFITLGRNALYDSNGVAVELMMNIPMAVVQSKLDNWHGKLTELLVGLREQLSQETELLERRFLIFQLPNALGKFDSALLLRSAQNDQLSNGRQLSLLEVVLLHRNERLWETQVGVHALIKRFQERGISTLFSADRPDVSDLSLQ